MFYYFVLFFRNHLWLPRTLLEAIHDFNETTDVLFNNNYPFDCCDLKKRIESVRCEFYGFLVTLEGSNVRSTC